MLGVPDGFMMAGWHKSQNRICGSLLNNFDGNTLSIGGVASLTRNQRFGMLSCDEGFVAVGVHHGNGELLQQPLPSGLSFICITSASVTNPDGVSSMECMRADLAMGLLVHIMIITCLPQLRLANRRIWKANR